MDEVDGINVMAEACLRAHEAVDEHGTPEMQATMSILLFQIGEEITRREAERSKPHNGS